MKLFRLLLIILCVVTVGVMPEKATARWQQVFQLSCTRSFLLTAEGNMLASDMKPGSKGGIYFSEDYGKNWTKADVADHHYTQFNQVGDLIFALGEGGYIARSTDGGRQWEELYYCEDFLDEIPWGDVESCDCYGLAVHGQRIYIANFAYLGVMYSEDYGDSWHLTSIEGMEIEDEGVVMADNLYNVLSYGGSLYAFGINKVYRYDEDGDRWETAREGTNFLTLLTEHRGYLVAGRGTHNDSFDVNFLEKTSDGVNWEGVGRPANFVHNNIRGLAADNSILVAGTANNGIFVTADFGESWEDITSGMPLYDNHPGVYLWPVTLQTDDEYIYAALYNPSQYDMKDSGIWRYPKASLAGVDAVQSHGTLGLTVSGRRLRVSTNIPGESVALELYTTSGAKVMESHVEDTDAGALPSGIYVYKLTTVSETMSGKITLQ